MTKATSSIEAGKKDAEQFIKNEQIDYDPFIAISDMHLVRKTVPISYEALEKTLGEIDPELCETVKLRASQRAEELGASFSYDTYTKGMAEGVSAVWEKIRDQVLK